MSIFIAILTIAKDPKCRVPDRLRNASVCFNQLCNLSASAGNWRRESGLVCVKGKGIGDQRGAPAPGRR